MFSSRERNNWRAVKSRRSNVERPPKVDCYITPPPPFPPVFGRPRWRRRWQWAPLTCNLTDWLPDHHWPLFIAHAPPLSSTGNKPTSTQEHACAESKEWALSSVGAFCTISALLDNSLCPKLPSPPDQVCRKSETGFFLLRMLYWVNPSPFFKKWSAHHSTHNYPLT